MKQEIQERWGEILAYMKTEYNISDVSYRTWLKDLTCYDVDDNIVTIIIDDNKIGENALEFIRNKYGIFIKTAIAEITNEDYEINFVLKSFIIEQEKKEKSKENEENSFNKVNYLNPKYTFDNFVVGDNNNAAQAASLAVAESPGNTFNPLFIYGGAGLGKTHLMYAIANYLVEHRPELKVLYVSSETFTNDLIKLIRPGSYNSDTEEFRHKYRDNDVLLIDDIQFIIGKERTQEEFFHTFNEMRETNRQIVISSDKPPRDMQILDERFRSRFQSGLTVDIQPPAFETRMAILKRKSSMDNLYIKEGVLEYIAENIKSNIRELEGALTKVVAMGRLQKREINIDLAVEALKDIISPDERKTITPEFILNVVAEHYNLTPSMLTNKNRSRDVAYPRQICMYLCKKLTSSSLADIGKILEKDHTTILHGYNKIIADLENDESLKNTIDILIKKINPPE
ncbi:MAG: chromosomal replication initiator protein DnaA [Lachnospiraceae bacterium]|nr:chromosomal replication initiator protein DnaA [Lachnospiraceae bacterium]